jgi:hypothetical protein
MIPAEKIIKRDIINALRKRLGILRVFRLY